jgi:hypothetical protein
LQLRNNIQRRGEILGGLYFLSLANMGFDTILQSLNRVSRD